MSRQKITVYLAELIHSDYGLSLLTVPLGIGVVGSYCKNIHKDNIDLQLFRTFNDFFNAVKKKKPDIIGFAYFSWNESLTMGAVKIVRQLCPDTVIVVGGPSIVNDLEDSILKPGSHQEELEHQYNVSLTPYNNYHFLKENPEIDFIVYGDGEIPFNNVVTSYISGKSRTEMRRESIDGCISFIDGAVVRGNPVETILDLDVTPSPYTTGLFGEFLENFKLTPQIETLRGCPFKCTFCTVGGLSPRLRKHSLEYIKEEILYLKAHSPNKILRIADPNWGIVEQDIKVAEFIKELHDTTGYPSSLRVYYSAKGPIGNIKIMAKLMKNLLPLNMSFQTLNKDTLKNIKRSNFSLEKIEEMRKFGTENGLATSTELISGLPGETYESFRQGFLTAVRLGIDSIYINPLYLIKGAELDANDARVKFGFKTAYMLIGKDVTKIDDDHYVFEKDEMVVESSSMPREDYWKLHKFRLFALLAYAAAFLKEIIMHCLNYDITPLDLFDELTEGAEEYPFFNKKFSEYIENIKALHFENPEDLEKKIAENIKDGTGIGVLDAYKQSTHTMGKMLGDPQKYSFSSEIIKAASNIFKKRGHKTSIEEKDFFDILTILTKITPFLIISPCDEHLEKDILFESHYNFVAWAHTNYQKRLVEFYSETPMTFVFSVRNFNEHKDVLNIIKNSDWQEAEKFCFYFYTIVSSNLRRFISCKKVGNGIEEEKLTCALNKV